MARMTSRHAMFCLVLITCLCETVISNESRQVTYEVLRFSGLPTSHCTIYTRNSNSVLECSSHCLQQADCYSFQWLNGICTLHIGCVSPAPQPTAVQTAVQTAVPTGSNHFVRSDLCEMIGYADLPDVGVCIRLYPEFLNHTAAVATCKEEYNGHLLVIDTDSKLRRVQQYLTANSYGHYVTIIDGTDKATEGDWRHHNGEPITYWQWGGVEPVDSYTDREDCLALDPGYHFNMNDVLCDDPHPFICELNLQ
ncbi:uncharacterized protein LOC117340760 [Pecten maximus]|uniref:uncharacterized protein LOC117340760 n=1 Tax=Pecten maximus TaxID=6579 RepID=UPI001459152E|nr:uncharacterized protein LOC117340760 [Pecten maximus]